MRSLRPGLRRSTRLVDGRRTVCYRRLASIGGMQAGSRSHRSTRNGGQGIAMQQHVDPSRRRFLQTAAVGLAFAPMFGAHAVANAESAPEQVAASAAGGLSIV